MASLSTTVTVYPTYTWNLNVNCHELGHCFGSPHTHACAWGPNGNTQIDDCGSEAGYPEGSCYDSLNPIIPAYGTIMSYCHLGDSGSNGIDLALGFGSEPGDTVRARYNAATCTNGTSCSPLPVTLLSFDAAKRGTVADLYWQTEAERDFLAFEIYRRADSGEWEFLGRVAPQVDQTGVKEYRLTDYSPHAGTNYYRLNMVDYDSRFEWSDIRSVSFGNEIAPEVTYDPARQVLRFAFVPDDGLDVLLIDVLGRVLVGRHIVPGETLEVSALPAGIYWLRMGRHVVKLRLVAR